MNNPVLMVKKNCCGLGKIVWCGGRMQITCTYLPWWISRLRKGFNSFISWSLSASENLQFMQFKLILSWCTWCIVPYNTICIFAYPTQHKWWFKIKGLFWLIIFIISILLWRQKIFLGVKIFFVCKIEKKLQTLCYLWYLKHLYHIVIKNSFIISV